MRKKIYSLIGILVVLSLVFSCTAKNVPFSELTPKEKLVYMYQIYNAQHEDYMIMSGNPNLTEAQKQVLRTKKPILETLQVSIPLYDQSIQSGAPSHEAEQQIYNLLTQLQTMAGN